MQVIVCSASPASLGAINQAFSQEDRLTLCESGLELLGAVGTVASDFVILDLDTPGLSTLFLVSAIQELAPQLPIVAVSAQPNADVRALTQKGVTYSVLGPDGHNGPYASLADLIHAERLKPSSRWGRFAAESVPRTGHAVSAGHHHNMD